MSFLKKLMKKKDEEQRSSSAAGVQAMSSELQMKYAKGVQYNMKVIIKGDRNVGKSTLFLRLQGQKFREEYLPTDEIQVANIQWNYKTTDDIVKVEVWDVVDKARRKPTGDAGLKLKHQDEEDDSESPKLDAQFVDVYKGTHAVIMIYDMTKQWTWQYVEREVPKVPSHLPIVILANNRDMGQHRTVDLDTTAYFVSSLERGEGAAPVRFTESSLLNGYGLKYLHGFFNVPFLALQRDTLLRQLEANTRETEAISQELDMIGESNYEKILEAGKLRRGQPNTARSQPVQPNPQSNLGGQSAYIPSTNRGPAGSNVRPSQSVDDFRPELSGEAMDFFGTDDSKQSTKKKPPSKLPSDDEEAGDSNPMVATFEDDFYSSDDEPPPVTKPTKPAGSVKIASADVVLSSDEEEEEVKPPTDSESDREESSIDKLTRQFGETVSTSEARRHESSEGSEEETGPPVIMTLDEDVSDSESRTTSNSHGPPPALTSHSVPVKPSSRDVDLTDSDEDYNRPQVMNTEPVSSDGESQVTPAVQLPDIATSHQTSKVSDDQTKIKKKKKTKKERTTQDGDEEAKPKKKTKKSKKSGDGDPSVKPKKKSKAKSAKPALDPLEQFLAGDDDSQGQASNYECI